MENKLNILVLSGWYPNDREPNEGDFVKHQVELLRKEGLHIDVVFGDWSVRNLARLFDAKLQINESKNGVTWEYSSFFYPRKLNYTMHLWRKAYLKYIDLYIEKHGLPDLIHAHTYLAAWVAAGVKEKHGLPYCLTEHSTLVLSDELSVLHKNIASEAYEKADSIMTVSQSLSTAINDTYGVTSVVVPNFIDIQLFKPSSKKVNDDVFKMICIGDLIDRKQIDVLLYSLQEIDHQYHLSIVGDGPLKKKLQLITHRLGLSDKVTFTGRHNNSEIAKLLQKMDVLIHPSRLETFGIVLIEALCSGLPVIAFKNGGAEDIINESNGLLINERSLTALRSAIKKMILTKDQYSSEKIRTEALAKYAPPIVKTQLLEQYNSIMLKK